MRQDTPPFHYLRVDATMPRIDIYCRCRRHLLRLFAFDVIRAVYAAF